MIEHIPTGIMSRAEVGRDEVDIFEVAKQVKEQVLNRGKLTKTEILLLFSLPAERYSELRNVIISSFSDDIESGPQRIGGLVAKYHRRGRPTKDVLPPARFELAEWEKVTVAKLVDMLDHKTIEDLLGDLKYTVRKLREVETGKDVRGTKEDLANALLIKHGRDLFADKEVRSAIAKACNLDNPGAWHPGKEGAIGFVEKCSFPRELAGILAPERQPDFERLEGSVNLPPLLDFQAELHNEILKRLLSKPTRAIATLPTGAGKTRLMVEAIKDYWKTSRATAVIWLAHTEELCEQAYQCFKEVWEANSDVVPVTSIRYWGSYSRTLDTHSHAIKSLIDEKVLVISTPVRLVNALKHDGSHANEFATSLAAAVNVVIVDEAHRAGAPTYRELISQIREVNSAACFIGLTATPYRTEYANANSGITALKEIFDELLEARSLGDSPREALQRIKVLAGLEIRELKTEIDFRLPTAVPDNLDALSLDQHEGVDKIIQAGTDVPRRRLAILPYIKNIAMDPTCSILYFGPTVPDATAMTFLLRNYGISAAFVSADTRTSTRRQIIHDFKSGTIRVICNCEVLTTGFDAPRVTHIVIARPTVSRVLWEQMIGRGLRGPKFGGTETCVVYDCVDNFTGDPGKVSGFTEYKATWRRELTSAK